MEKGRKGRGLSKKASFLSRKKELRSEGERI